MSYGFLLILFSVPAAGELPPNVVNVLDATCADCHGGGEAAGGFAIEQLEAGLNDADAVRLLTKAHDRVADGVMPPSEYGELSATDRQSFLAGLSKSLTRADQTRRRQDGRSAIRRLNRSEFETTLEDLFGIPLDIAGQLPEDGRGHGFDTVGGSLNLSAVQMEAYLDTLDGVLDRATALYERPPVKTRRLTFLQNNGIMQVYRKSQPVQLRENGVVLMATEKFSHFNSVLGQYAVPHLAKYRISVRAAAVRSDEPIVLTIRAGGTGHAESNHVPSRVLKHCFVKPGETQEFTWEGWLERGHYLHVYPSSLRAMRFVGKDRWDTRDDYDGPGVLFEHLNIEGPFFDKWPPPSHQRLWSGVATKPLPDAKPDKVNEHLDGPPSQTAKPRMTQVKADKKSGNKFVYDPEKQSEGGEPIYRNQPIPQPVEPTLRLAPSNPRHTARLLLQDFAEAAFRRPTSRTEVTPYVELAESWLDAGEDFESAMRAAYKAVLVSPAFLYHRGEVTDAGTLDQYAVASRLSYFLTNGPPDAELLRAAAAGELDADGRRSHAQRLLASPKSDRFIRHFTDEWLDLRLIDFTAPDSDLYPEHDPLLEWSMLQETRGFVRQLITENRPASNIGDSDFAMLNWRLARHYGLPAVDGMEVRPVPLPADTVRGGLLTQASVLKVTANGTTTSPVVRGAWVLDRILGEPPEPPPPGVPAVEPDIRGATTVREQLAAHREAESCNACHKSIDPPGVALESFDVIGQFRDVYRAIDPTKEELKIAYGPTPPPLKWTDGLPVDPSDELAYRGPFEGIEGFKQMLCEDDRVLASAFLDKLIVYSTGGSVTFADRAERDAILDATAPRYGVRTLILDLVASDLFTRK